MSIIQMIQIACQRLSKRHQVERLQAALKIQTMMHQELKFKSNLSQARFRFQVWITLLINVNLIHLQIEPLGKQSKRSIWKNHHQFTLSSRSKKIHMRLETLS